MPTFANFNQYFYFIGASIMLPVWIILFSNKAYRRRMIIVGIIIGIGATIIEHTYALADYWRPIYLFPHFPFEDFYYGFVFGGISTAFSEFLFNKRDSKKRTYPAYQKLIILFTLLTTLCFLYFVHFLQLNSIVAHITPPILLGLTVLIIRKDLFFYACSNGILTAGLTLIMFLILKSLYPQIFQNHWYLENLSQHFILTIPIEEILFGFAMGFGLGCAYELINGYSEITNIKLMKKRMRRIKK